MVDVVNWWNLSTPTVENVLHLFLCIPQKCLCLKIHDLIVVNNIPLTQILLHKCHNNIAFTHWVRSTPLNTYDRRCSIMSTFIHTTKTPLSNFACIHTAPSHLQQSTNNCSLVYIILLFKIAIKTSPTSGRLLSPHRSRLHPKTIEAMMCAQNWLWSEING